MVLACEPSKVQACDGLQFQDGSEKSRVNAALPPPRSTVLGAKAMARSDWLSPRVPVAVVTSPVLAIPVATTSRLRIASIARLSVSAAESTLSSSLNLPAPKVSVYVSPTLLRLKTWDESAPSIVQSMFSRVWLPVVPPSPPHAELVHAAPHPDPSDQLPPLTLIISAFEVPGSIMAAVNAAAPSRFDKRILILPFCTDACVGNYCCPCTPDSKNESTGHIHVYGTAVKIYKQVGTGSTCKENRQNPWPAGLAPPWRGR